MHAAILFSNSRFHKTRPRDSNRRRAVQVKDKSRARYQLHQIFFADILHLVQETRVFKVDWVAQ